MRESSQCGKASQRRQVPKKKKKKRETDSEREGEKETAGKCRRGEIKPKAPRARAANGSFSPT